MTLQLSNPIFIMTTHWDKHWDGVTNSNYDEKWIKFNPGILNVGIEFETVFIKVSKLTYDIERVWIGKSKITSIINSKYEFEVILDKEIPVELFKDEFLSIFHNVRFPGW